MRSPPVCCTVGKRGPVTLLLKHPDQPVQEAHLRGITISSHISKLEPAAFYAPAIAIYERALGGPCLVGGLRGVSLREVVCTAHMKLDLAMLQHWVVDVLITDPAKFFNVIAQDVHPIVGAHVGPGGGQPPGYPHGGLLICPNPGPLAIEYPGAAPGYPLGYNPRSPCGGHGGSPLSAVH